MPLEIVKTGSKLLSTNLAPGTRLRKAESRERNTLVAGEVADAELAKMSSNAEEVVEFRKRQATSNVYVQELTAELKRRKARLIQATAKHLELLMRLDAVAAESDKTLEELADVRGSRDLAEFLVWSFFDQSVGALPAFFKQVGV